MAMPPLLQRIENLRKSVFGPGTKILGTIIPYGSAANTVCQGNDSRLSDARTPKAHTHSSSDLTGTVPVDKGGTGAVTAEAARENLEITPANIGALPAGGKAASATTADSAAKLTTARTISLSGDMTGTTSFDGSEDKSIAATLAASGVTAGSYGPSANATPAAGATFSVPQLTVDAKGRVTEAVSRTVKIPAEPTSVSGNAGTATKLQTARTFQVDLASTDGVSFDGSANVTPGVKGILSVANGGTGNSTGNALSAMKATQDASGNVITSTYATKAEMNAVKTTANNALPKSGGTMTGPINMNGQNVTGMNHVVFSNGAELWVA